jgi:hypothetical protein
MANWWFRPGAARRKKRQTTAPRTRSHARRATVLATWPLPDPAKAPQQFTLMADLPQLGLKDESDVCFQFTASPAGPFYTVQQVRWSAKPAGAAQ